MKEGGFDNYFTDHIEFTSDIKGNNGPVTFKITCHLPTSCFLDVASYIHENLCFISEYLLEYAQIKSRCLGQGFDISACTPHTNPKYGQRLIVETNHQGSDYKYTTENTSVSEFLTELKITILIYI